MAELAPADPAVLPLFEAACVTGELSFAAREAVIAADPQWVPTTTVDVDVPAFQAVPVQPVAMNFDYSKPLVVKQWNRTVDRQPVRLVLAQFDAKRRYPVLCGLVVADVAQTAMSYDDEFKRIVKSVGLKGKSVDLVHYFEFSGKLADGRPARADIFTRSRTLGSGKTMHLDIAF